MRRMTAYLGDAGSASTVVAGVGAGIAKSLVGLEGTLVVCDFAGCLGSVGNGEGRGSADGGGFEVLGLNKKMRFNIIDGS